MKRKEKELTNGQRAGEKIAEESFGPVQTMLYNKLKTTEMNWHIAALLVRHYPSDNITEALEKHNDPSSIYDHIKRYEHKQDFAKDKVVWNIYSDLQERFLLEPAIIDIIALYPVETIEQILEISPKLTTMDLIEELRKHDYKPEIIENIANLNKREEKALKFSKEIKHIETETETIQDQEEVQPEEEQEEAEELSYDDYEDEIVF